MKIDLNACDLWDAIEGDYEVSDLSAYPTMQQIKIYEEKKKKKSQSDLLVCFCFSQHIHKNHEFAFTKRHMGLSQRDFFIHNQY